MKIGDLSTPSSSPSPIARVDPALRPAAGERTVADDSLHQARISAVVELIESLTGREVKLVPPAAYLVSRPAPPLETPVDLVVRADLTSSHSTPTDTPLEVGIHSILRNGTTSRMVLGADARGGLDLTAAVAVDL